MTPTPVGMRCPECASDKTRVRTGPAATSQVGGNPATVALIAINVMVFLAEMATGSGGLNSTSSSLINDYGLIGAMVADGEPYRLLTSGFLHAGFMHIAFNMIALFFLGRVLEPSIGTTRFLMVYFASLFAGSLGAILLSSNIAITVGASGAVFGLFAATFIIAYGRGLGHIANEIGVIIDQALADMDALGIHGKDATPYLLGRIVEITGGASLTANIALVRNNARLGAAIAREYAALRG